MVMAKHSAGTSYRRLRRRHRWLVFAALACMLGLYSLQVTHLHPSTQSSLEYPKSQVEKPVLLDDLLPDLAAAVSFNVSYYVDTPYQDDVFAGDPPRLQPPSRAPPFLRS